MSNSWPIMPSCTGHWSRRSAKRGYGLRTSPEPVELLKTSNGSFSSSAMALLEELEHALGGPREDGAVPADNDRALHELGMREQELHDLLAGHVVLRVEAEL